MASSISKSLGLFKGPAGRAVAQPLDNGLLEALNEHITMERSASAQYFAISIWFKEREFKGFSKFFNKESHSEQEHASSFANYLVARGQSVLLENLPSPKQDFQSVEEVVKYSFQMEADVTTSLHQLYSIAERSSDIRTTVYLDQVIEDQISSEDEFAYLLGKITFAKADPSAIFIIDNELNN